VHQLEIKVLNIIDARCNREFYTRFVLKSTQNFADFKITYLLLKETWGGVVVKALRY